MLIGDDDNSLTVAKGNIDSYSGQTFVYSLNNPLGTGTPTFRVDNFVKQTTLNSATPVAIWTQTEYDSTLSPTLYHGEAIFTLLFQR